MKRNIILVLFILILSVALYHSYSNNERMEKIIVKQNKLIKRYEETQEQTYRLLADIYVYSVEKQELDVIDQDKLKWFIANYEWIKDNVDMED